MAAQKRLFLVDAYALIFRGYYAFIKNPRINSKGFDTSAIMGFMNSLFDVIRREKPDHLAVCFDKEGSQVRTEMFSDYKANRDATPEPIMQGIPYIQNILKAMHIPVVELPGCEADDIIGTLAKQAEKENYQVYMVTPDKDFAQLVSENIFMYRPARMGNGIEIWGIPEVQKKFEVERPEQVIDFLGMMGDAVDNIPGLPGVGEKTPAPSFRTRISQPLDEICATSRFSCKTPMQANGKCRLHQFPQFHRACKRVGSSNVILAGISRNATPQFLDKVGFSVVRPRAD